MAVELLLSRSLHQDCRSQPRSDSADIVPDPLPHTLCHLHQCHITGVLCTVQICRHSYMLFKELTKLLTNLNHCKFFYTLKHYYAVIC